MDSHLLLLGDGSRRCSFVASPDGEAAIGVFRRPGGRSAREIDSQGRGSKAASRGEYSRLLVSDYLGYDSWRSRYAYVSCDRSNHAGIVEEDYHYSAYWSVGSAAGPEAPDIKLNAAYTDGHVEAYKASEAVPMWVSTTPDGTTPDTVGPGIFYLPPQALR